MKNDNQFPEGMEPLGTASFSFLCHPNVSCFTVCCQDVDLDLYPYDIIRLKNFLNIDSETFVRNHTELKQGGNPYFPSVKLKLVDYQGKKACPFLSADGCSVYKDRPTSCRTYPLERAVSRNPRRGRPDEFYFVTNHHYCQGHKENHEFTARKWVRNQRLDDYNIMNDLWAEVDTLFSTNPWKGEGAGGNHQQLAFMICYNIDGFRAFVQENRLTEQFAINRDLKRRIGRDDVELLKFGFEWIKGLLGGASSLVKM